jgi:hypothetical protein
VVLGAGWVLLFPGFQVRYHHARSQAAARDLVALASSKGMTAAQLAQAWAASRLAAGSCVKDHAGSREGQQASALLLLCAFPYHAMPGAVSGWINVPVTASGVLSLVQAVGLVLSGFASV